MTQEFYPGKILPGRLQRPLVIDLRPPRLIGEASRALRCKRCRCMGVKELENTSRRKQLKQEYKRVRPDMGVFMIRSNATGKVFVEQAQDLRSAMNANRFRLNAGLHRNRELQRDWQQYGEGDFTVAVLDTLEYAREESKTDYTDDLLELRAIWMGNLARDGTTFYNQQPPSSGDQKT